MDSIGFLEFNSIAKGIEAADAVIKAADVRLAFAKASCPGKYYLLFYGEVAAVQASLDAGALIGGIFLGIIEILVGAYISTELATPIVFLILIVVLLVKPNGLLGKKINEKV